MVEQPHISRRAFAKAAGALGALAATGASVPLSARPALADDAQFPELPASQPLEATVDVETGEVRVNDDVIVRYSACLGCHSVCGNRLKMDRQTKRIVSVGGNPYNPNNSTSYLDFSTPLEDAYRSMSFANKQGNRTRGTLCGRGHGTFDACSQPNRVTVPLKRAGKRGEGKWEPITWDQLIGEVTEGGKLFAHLGEEHEVQGFKALHDTETPLNPQQPDLGPVSNQVVFFGGRGDGRTVFSNRFASCYGTVNDYRHTSS